MRFCSFSRIRNATSAYFAALWMCKVEPNVAFEGFYWDEAIRYPTQSTGLMQPASTFWMVGLKVIPDGEKSGPMHRVRFLKIRLLFAPTAGLVNDAPGMRAHLPPLSRPGQRPGSDRDQASLKNRAMSLGASLPPGGHVCFALWKY